MALNLVGCNEQILHDLSENDANKVISRLSAGKLGAQKVLQSDGRWAISVPRDVIVPALAYLDSNRVLSPRSASLNQAGKGGFVPSREEQWFRYERSIANSIEESLSAMLGVLEARVHLNLPETDPLFGTRKESTGSGSVLLVVDTRYSAKDEEISSLVSGAAGIPGNRITVLKSQAQQTGGLEGSTGVDQAIASQLPKDAQGDRRGIVKLDSFSANREVVFASAAVVAFAGFGFLALRLRRRRRVTFSLPSGSDLED